MDLAEARGFKAAAPDAYRFASSQPARQEMGGGSRRDMDNKEAEASLHEYAWQNAQQIRTFASPRRKASAHPHTPRERVPGDLDRIPSGLGGPPPPPRARLCPYPLKLRAVAE